MSAPPSATPWGEAGSGGQAAPPAPRGRSRCGQCVAVLSIAVGLVGVVLAAEPSLGGSLLAALRCPAAFRTPAWRPSWLVSRLPSVARPPVPHGVEAASGLPFFDARDLAAFTAPPAVLLAINGDVFDVTERGLHFYGPGAGYSMFAGRDASRSLTLGSLSTLDLNLGGDCGDFSPERVDTLREQHAFYVGKYVLVGKLRGRSGFAVDGVLTDGVGERTPGVVYDAPEEEPGGAADAGGAAGAGAGAEGGAADASAGGAAEEGAPPAPAE